MTALAASAAALVMSAGMLTAEPVDEGAILFADFCAVCHGASGKGDGDMAALMTTPPPDLTALSARNDGEFPMLKVIHTIDGRTGVRSHGNPMPIFGRVFSFGADDEYNPYGSVLEVRGRILSLALYLESIQG